MVKNNTPTFEILMLSDTVPVLEDILLLPVVGHSRNHLLTIVRACHGRKRKILIQSVIVLEILIIPVLASTLPFLVIGH